MTPNESWFVFGKHVFGQTKQLATGNTYPLLSNLFFLSWHRSLHLARAGPFISVCTNPSHSLRTSPASRSFLESPLNLQSQSIFASPTAFLLFLYHGHLKFVHCRISSVHLSNYVTKDLSFLRCDLKHLYSKYLLVQGLTSLGKRRKLPRMKFLQNPNIAWSAVIMTS